MESIWNAVRAKVSADKNRYTKGSYDLDLTYITDRIIAMAYPADGMESTYRNKIDDVAQLLKENHGDRFMIYNLSERPYDYSKFDNQVNEWCGFPDHHGPPLRKLFQIIKSIHSWLNADSKNVVVIHCLAGKGRTGLVIAAYFLYCGLFNTPENALSYFACRRSTNNWGVTNPCQIRCVQYLNDIIVKGVVPSTRYLSLVYVHLSGVPNFSGMNPLMRSSGCAPFIHIYHTADTKKLIYSSEHDNEEIKSYSPGHPVTFQVECVLQGDIEIEIYHVTSFYRQEHMLRLQFHTGMIKNKVLRFMRSDIDLACQDKRFSNDFFVDLGFESVPNKYEDKDDKWWEGIPKGDGSICFIDKSKLAEAKNIANIQKNKVEKGGYLTKRGHAVKNWKKRWFVLKDPTLCYFKSPRDTTPAGVIILDDILTIISEKNIYKDIKPVDRPNYWFEIITKKTNYLICADSEQEMSDWVDALEFVISQREERTSQELYRFTDVQKSFYDESFVNNLMTEFLQDNNNGNLKNNSSDMMKHITGIPIDNNNNSKEEEEIDNHISQSVSEVEQTLKDLKLSDLMNSNRSDKGTSNAITNSNSNSTISVENEDSNSNSVNNSCETILNTATINTPVDKVTKTTNSKEAMDGEFTIIPSNINLREKDFVIVGNDTKS